MRRGKDQRHIVDKDGLEALLCAGYVLSIGKPPAINKVEDVWKKRGMLASFRPRTKYLIAHPNSCSDSICPLTSGYIIKHMLQGSTYQRMTNYYWWITYSSTVICPDINHMWEALKRLGVTQCWTLGLTPIRKIHLDYEDT